MEVCTHLGACLYKLPGEIRTNRLESERQIVEGLVSRGFVSWSPFGGYMTREPSRHYCYY